MQLLNEMTSPERRQREQGKRHCRRCGRWDRVRVEQRIFSLLWTGDQRLSPRRFLRAQMRITEEKWLCPDCPEADPRTPAIGLVMDFEHVGHPDEIVAL
jgi:hypothetical protein